MCGIAGILFSDPTRPAEQTLLRRMGASIAHRGPDAEGFLTEPGVGLVHRRLSIIDLAGGDQPIGNEDGSVQVVFNGEIYNYRLLRNELEARGHRFQTQSDTEVLVHLYEDLGDRLVERLRGMFAFALWDRRRRSLILARDRLGIKPLYYYRGSDRLVFGSELKALLADPSVPREVDPAALENCLAFGMVPGAATIFRGLQKLPPGHVLTVTDRNWHVPPRQYWQLRARPQKGRDLRAWQEELRYRVAETVQAHLIADVPVGAFLSGGLDSALVVAHSAGKTEGRLQTFSVGFREEAFSELPYARQVADRFATEHYEEVVTADAVGLVGELARYFDEPFADPSAVPTYLVAQVARRRVKVALSGDGGDEAFGGYRRYAHDLAESRVRAALPAWLRRGLIGPLGQLYPKADWLPRPLRAKTRLTNLALDAASAYANTLTICRRPLRRRLLHADVSAALNGHEPEQLVREAYARGVEGDELTGMIAADVATLLPDDFLVKVDRASMAHGLEVRPPFLDHELLEFAAGMPSDLKVRDGQTKWIVKQTFRDDLPQGLVDRPKQGFELPVDDWFRGPLGGLFEDTVLRPGHRVSSLVNQPVAKGLLQAHRRRLGRHGQVLWSLLTLACWADRYLGGGDLELMTAAAVQ